MRVLLLPLALLVPLAHTFAPIGNNRHSICNYLPTTRSGNHISTTRITLSSPSDGSSGSSDASDGPDASESFEDALKRLNKQFDSSPGEPSTPSPPPSTSMGDDTLSSLPPPSSADFKIPKAPSSSFAVSQGIGVSTSSWTSGPGFVTKQLPKSKRAGTWNPGDLSVQYTTLLDGGVTFFQTNEKDDYCEEMLGMFDASSRSMEVAKVRG